jgi:hypothetical protein
MRRSAICTFEYMDPKSLQMIVLEQDDDHHQVIEIAQVRLDLPRDEIISDLTRFVTKSGLPFDLKFRTHWPVDISEAQDLKQVFNAILDAYPKQDGDLVTHDKIISTGD